MVSIGVPFIELSGVPWEEERLDLFLSVLVQPKRNRLKNKVTQIFPHPLSIMFL